MNKFEAQKIAWEGRKLTKREASDLEAQLRAGGTEVDGRIRLLGYYFRKTLFDKEIKALAVKHVVWIINNYPDEAVQL